jgi:lysyl-tRNA synthetase class 1
MGTPMLAAAALQTSLEAYEARGRATKASAFVSPCSKRSANRKMRWPRSALRSRSRKDDVEKFLSEIIVDDLRTTFVRLAAEFLPKRKQLEDTVKKMAETTARLWRTFPKK